MSNKLIDCIGAGFPAVVYETSDEKRAVKICNDVAQEFKLNFKVWNITYGLLSYREYLDKESRDINQAQTGAPEDVIKLHMKDTGSIICILDFHPYLTRPQVVNMIKNCFDVAEDYGVTFVFISEKFNVPDDIKHKMIFCDEEYPSDEEYAEIIRKVEAVTNKKIAEEIERQGITQKLPELSETEKAKKAEKEKKLITALRGMNLEEAKYALQMSMSTYGEYDVKAIFDTKKSLFCKDGLLEYCEVTEDMNEIGGMGELKNYLSERGMTVFDEDARKYGLPYPKGVILFGVPGCGKTLSAKAAASMWGVPLIKFDIGKLFGSLVGETENNTRRALKLAETMSPCVLLVDELEKALSGTQTSGRTDSGVTSRLFGTLLSWLQDKTAPVYVIATANSIELPPELLRKGRFDEIFFIDLPTLEEREEIFRVSIKRHKRNVEDFEKDIHQLADASDQFSGAEIENAVVAAMYHAFADGKREFTSDDIMDAIKNTTCDACGATSTAIESLRNWSKAHHIRPATGVTKANAKATNSTVEGDKPILGGGIRRRISASSTSKGA